jgi:hypothetical protein
MALYKSLQKLTPLELETLINEELAPRVKNNGATELEAEQYEMAVKLQGSISREVQSDLLSFAARQGEDIGSIDSPEGMSQRLASAEALAERYSVPVKLFTKEEANSITTRLNEQPVQDQVAFIHEVSRNFGSRAPEAMEQLGEKDAVFAHFGGLATVSPDHLEVVTSGLEGKKILKENPDVKPSKAEVDFQFRNIVGDAFRFLPKEEVAIKNAAVALYVREAFAEGEIDSFNRSLFETSIRRVLGGYDDSYTAIGRINGKSFILPPTISEGQFEDFVDDLTPDLLLQYSLGGEPPRYANGKLVSPEDIQDEAAFVSIGNGQYRILMDDGFLSGGAADGLYVLTVTPEQIKEVMGK